LVNALVQTVDALHYADQGDWAERRATGGAGWQWETRADGLGRTLELRDASVSNEWGQNWDSSILESGGTPGLPNSRATDNLPPIITDVSHEPVIPKSNDFVTIRAKIIDTDLDAVALFLRDSNSDGDFEQESMILADESSDTYEAIIPPQEDKVVIEFYVSASDTERTRKWPGPSTEPSIFNQGRQETNALYQVDDEILPGTTYYLTMSTPERRRFDSLSRQSNAEMNTTLITSIGDEQKVRYLCGVRFRGNSSRGTNPPPKKINLPRDRPLNRETPFNLNSHTPYNQLVGNLLFTAAGLVAPDARLVEVRENDNETRPYVHVPPYGGEFVDEYFPDINQSKATSIGNAAPKEPGT
jgi:hypothetical protein